MPKVQEILNGLSKAKWFTEPDLQAGYHQVQIAGQNRWKTAFKTKYGTYASTAMPFGLSEAPATFQRIMQEIFLEELDDFVAVYLDDILICSSTRETHLQHIKQVLQKLHKASLHIKLKKCDFAKKQVAYLGYTIGEQGLKSDPRHGEAVPNGPNA